MKGPFGSLLDFMRKQYGEPVGVGRHRTVFRDGDWVYKVPHDSWGYGMASNDLESSGPAWTGEPCRFARCELVAIQGSCVLKMEYVEHRGSSPHPDWTWSIDCGQVGYTKDGILVAYDWGL